MADEPDKAIDRRSSPGVLGWTLRILLGIYFVSALGILAVRHWVLPRADEFRQQVELSITESLGLPVSIGRVSAEWIGLRPTLELADLRISDADGRNALGLSLVDATLSWRSLARGHPVFRRLEIHGPELAVRREADGRILVAGLEAGGRSQDAGFGGWLFDQREIVIRDATLVWSDAQREAPPLVLERLNLRLDNRGDRHRFGLTAAPSAELAEKIDARGDFTGRDPAQWAQWPGELFVRLDDGDLGAWQQWVDYPVALSGRGDASAWIDRRGPASYSASVDLALRDARTRFRDDLPELVLTALNGSIRGRREGTEMELETSALQATGHNGVVLPALDLRFEYAPARGEELARGHVSAKHLDLAALASLAAHLPLEPVLLGRIAELSPTGELFDLVYGWRGDESAPSGWELRGRAEALSAAPGPGWPGFSGFSGSFAGDDQRGKFDLAGSEAALELPQIFADSRLPLSRAGIDGRWKRSAQGLELHLDRVHFANRDAAGTAGGVYRPRADGPGEIELTAQLSRADATRVWRYLPRVVGDTTRDWVREAIQAGRAGAASLQLRGDLADFPFADGERGLFQVDVSVSGVRLAYAPAWPAIDDISGKLRFKGSEMRVEADRGRVGDAAIGATTAVIAALGNGDEVLELRGTAAGPTQGFLDFVSGSPVAELIGNATDAYRASGDGALSLSLSLPLRRLDQSQVDGEYRFADNVVRLAQALPPLEQASARVGFDSNGVRLADASAVLLGEPVAADGGTRPDGSLVILASGTATARALQQETGWAVLEHVEGRTAWTCRIAVADGRAVVDVDSTLRDFGSSLPPPLAKAAGEDLPLNVQLEIGSRGARQHWRVRMGEQIRAEVARRQTGAGQWLMLRAGVAVGAPLRMADGGVMAAIQMPALDLDAWRAVVAERAASDGQDAANGARLAGFALRSERLTLFGEEISEVDTRAVADAGGWRGQIRSAAVEGEFDWRSRDKGALKAHFKRLALGRPAQRGGEAIRKAAEAAPDALPALDITADEFHVRGMALGRLSLFARNEGGRWSMERLKLSSDHGEINGAGDWTPGGSTELGFDVAVSDVGGYLAQIGYPEAVRRGKATLSGELGWQGAPSEVDYGSLKGRMEVVVEEGQFTKLEPGVGRLLGVLSLQSLPRRITLDFRDVFSEGFAFERIAGDLEVAQGVMHTDSLAIRGPAARIRLRGEVDLATEAQNLKVAVQPTLTESVAVGAALANSAAGIINPVAGLVTYLAQKIMEDPIEKLFSYEYAVTGGWDDPKVEQIRAEVPPPNVDPTQ